MVEKYDIANDTWSLAPAYNLKRIIHSGCTLGQYLYIYGGCNIKNNGPYFQNSIEFLDAHAHLNGSHTKW